MHGSNQPLDRARSTGRRATLVRRTQFRLLCAGTAARAGLRHRYLPLGGFRPRGARVHLDGSHHFSRLQWAADQHLSKHRAADPEYLVGLGTSLEPDFLARLCVDHPADHSFLHGAVLLGVPRQTPRRRGLSLIKDGRARSSLRSRLGWFAVLYLGGVLAAFMLAAAFHVLVSAQL